VARPHILKNGFGGQQPDVAASLPYTTGAMVAAAEEAPRVAARTDSGAELKSSATTTSTSKQCVQHLLTEPGKPTQTG
jgi:hypothetical protein